MLQLSFQIFGHTLIDVLGFKTSSTLIFWDQKSLLVQFSKLPQILIFPIAHILPWKPSGDEKSEVKVVAWSRRLGRYFTNIITIIFLHYQCFNPKSPDDMMAIVLPIRWECRSGKSRKLLGSSAQSPSTGLLSLSSLFIIASWDAIEPGLVSEWVSH